MIGGGARGIRLRSAPRPFRAAGLSGASRKSSRSKTPGQTIGSPALEELQVAVDRRLFLRANGDQPVRPVVDLGNGPHLGRLIASIRVDLMVGDMTAVPLYPVLERRQVVLAVNLEQGRPRGGSRQDRISGADVGQGQLRLARRALELDQSSRHPGGGLAQHQSQGPRVLTSGAPVGVNEGPSRHDRNLAQVERRLPSRGQLDQVAPDPEQAVLKLNPGRKERRYTRTRWRRGRRHQRRGFHTLLRLSLERSFRRGFGGGRCSTGGGLAIAGPSVDHQSGRGDQVTLDRDGAVGQTQRGPGRQTKSAPTPLRWNVIAEKHQVDPGALERPDSISMASDHSAQAGRDHVGPEPEPGTSRSRLGLKRPARRWRALDLKAGQHPVRISRDP